jgi:hypothetical protein
MGAIWDIVKYENINDASNFDAAFSPKPLPND